jgi:membrane-associated phospholipid phosphatase
MNSKRAGFIRLFMVSLTLLAAVSPCWPYERVEAAGDVATVLVGVAAGGMTLALQDLEGMEQLLKSAALDLALTYGLKAAVKAERPDGSDDHSFPSAHSSLAFTSAEYLRKRYGWEYGLPAYGVATFVAYSRVEADKHYTRDVLAGAAIGMASSFLFTTPHLKCNVTAEAAPGYYGIRLTQAW